MLWSPLTPSSLPPPPPLPRLPVGVAKILDDNQWSWAVTGVHQGGGLDCTLLIVKTEGRLPPSASDITWGQDVATTLAARSMPKQAPASAAPPQQQQALPVEAGAAEARSRAAGATGEAEEGAQAALAFAGGGAAGAGVEAAAEPTPPRWARSLSVRQGEQGALLRVLLFIVALSCLASGLCGNQRLERLVASLGLKGRKEDFADR